jgi:hypothetical protein
MVMSSSHYPTSSLSSQEMDEEVMEKDMNANRSINEEIWTHMT